MAKSKLSFHLGFTGTRKGITLLQKEELVQRLDSLCERFDVTLHHGGAPGADTQMHYLARKKVFAIEMYPASLRPLDTYLAASATVVHPARPPLLRNADIVNASSLMLATPDGYLEKPRGSGTWAAIRYTRKHNKMVTIIYPDGSIEQEGST